MSNGLYRLNCMLFVCDLIYLILVKIAQRKIFILKPVGILFVKLMNLNHLQTIRKRLKNEFQTILRWTDYGKTGNRFSDTRILDFRLTGCKFEIPEPMLFVLKYNML